MQGEKNNMKSKQRNKCRKDDSLKKLKLKKQKRKKHKKEEEKNYNKKKTPQDC